MTQTDSKSAMRLVVHADGGARNNPGPAAFGYVIRRSDGKLVERRGEYIGETTNNVAEYRGLIAAARRVADLGADAAQFCVDSELLERQIAGRYRVKSPHLKPLFAELMAELRRVQNWTVCHVPRELNGEADRLANQAIDSRGVVT
jgi:ribonuclease HI